MKTIYRVEVPGICALGIMTGYPDGTFRGDNLVNRAQACAVIQRMFKRMNERLSSVQFPAVVTDPAATSVAVGSDYYGNMGWSIVNNKYPDGTLNNGKPITEENVLAMLADAKTNWYPGMWFSTGVPGEVDNCYTPENGTSSAQGAIGFEARREVPGIVNDTIVGVNTMQSCAGFAAMLSDYIFGPSSNYPRTLTDPTQVRPGDIIIQKRIQENGPLVTDVAIALSGVEYNVRGTPMVRICAGGHNQKVVWDDPSQSPYTRLDTYMGGKDNAYQYLSVVLSRYPD